MPKRGKAMNETIISKTITIKVFITEAMIIRFLIVVS